MFELVRVVVVIATVGVAAALVTPKGRIPLALRGVQRILRSDTGIKTPSEAVRPVSSGRRLLAFVLIVFAIVFALI